MIIKKKPDIEKSQISNIMHSLFSKDRHADMELLAE